MKIRPVIIFSLFLIFISVWAMRALFHPGFYTSHDGWHQVARLYHFDKAIKDGQIPPRFSAELLNSFGYPLFIFSYHLPWWLAEPLVLLGMSIFDAIKVVFILTYVLSGLAMFWWLREIWGDMGGLAGALVYQFTPYRFANILVRANIGEAVSFMCIPLIFWGLYRAHKKQSVPAIVLGAVGIAGFVLSHIMVGFLFALTLIIYFLGLLTKATSKGKFILSALATVSLGLGLTAYYWLPAIFYKPLTVFSDFYHGLYQNHFTPLSKLIYSVWGYSPIGIPGEMSRQVGVVIWLMIALSLLSLLGRVLLGQSKSRFSLYNLFTGAFLISFISSVFLMMRASAPIWKMIESWSMIDFPWRFLAVTTFSGSVLTAGAASLIRSKLRYLVIVILFGALVYTNRNYVRVNQYTDIPLSLYIESELTTNTDDEYLPKWVDRTFAKKKKPLLTSDTTTVSNLTQTSNVTKLDYSQNSQATVSLYQMYFPGWQALIDGRTVLVSKNNFGGLNIDLPSGQHQLLLKYQPTAIMRFGDVLSLASLSLIGLWIFNRFIKLRRES